ncbi:MAG: RAD55 family ATPase [Candidatus Nanoarchaeia archaeon]
MERVPTGIKGFDNLVEGGLPLGSIVLVSGSPGTGKTIFGLEYIYRGANDFGEKGMFISFEQDPKDIREQAKQLGFENIEKLEQEEKIVFASLTAHMVDKHTANDILTEIKERKAERIVVDSLSALLINAPLHLVKYDNDLKELIKESREAEIMLTTEDIKKNFIYKFITDVKSTKATSLMLSEIPDNSEHLSSDGISEFVADGVLKITFESLGGEFSRSMTVRKMRETKNDEDVHPLEINKEGLIVHSLE